MWNEASLNMPAGAALSAYRLVKGSAGEAVYNTAAATDRPIGTTQYAVASGDDVAVKPLNAPGTHQMVASAAISQHADVFAAADGKISALPAAAGDYLRIGQALEAAAADGDIIQVLPYATPTVVTVA